MMDGNLQCKQCIDECQVCCGGAEYASISMVYDFFKAFAALTQNHHKCRPLGVHGEALEAWLIQIQKV